MFRFIMMVHQMLLNIIFALGQDLAVIDCQSLYNLGVNMFVFKKNFTDIIKTFKNRIKYLHICKLIKK